MNFSLNMYQHNIDVFTVNVLQTLACAETSHLKKKKGDKPQGSFYCGTTTKPGGGDNKVSLKILCDTLLAHHSFLEKCNGTRRTLIMSSSLWRNSIKAGELSCPKVGSI